MQADRSWARGALLLIVTALTFGCDDDDVDADDAGTTAAADPVVANATRMIEEGRRTFRFDTFGDEAFWGGQLELHRAIAGEANGGVGPGLTPTARSASA